MGNKLTFSKTFWVALVGAFTTGMGNGSVFGAALLLFVGPGPFEEWGGWGTEYSPFTHSGFHNWTMYIFGLAFMVIVMAAMAKHGRIEAARAASVK